MTATLDWYGCATFRLTVGELVVFLDAYIDRAEGAAGTGLTAGDIDRCDFVVVGHSHFDHLWGAERIARNTGATIIGSFETVRVMETQGVPLAQLMPVAGGERIRLADEVSVSVYPSLHSCIWSHASASDPSEVCLGDLGVRYQDRQARLAEMDIGWNPLARRSPSTSRAASRAHAGTAALCATSSTRPADGCSTRTPPATGPEWCRGSVPTSPSSPQPAEATSTVSRSRARWPSLSAAKPHCYAPGGLSWPPRQLAPWIFRLHRRRPVPRGTCPVHARCGRG